MEEVRGGGDRPTVEGTILSQRISLQNSACINQYLVLELLVVNASIENGRVWKLSLLAMRLCFEGKEEEEEEEEKHSGFCEQEFYSLFPIYEGKWTLYELTENSDRLLSIVCSPSSKNVQAEVLSTREKTSI